MRAWLVVAVLLIAIRGLHLGGPIDDPHSWRQCDTAHISLDFARRGIDLLHPAVGWLGHHRTLIFEFPLAEAMSAVLDRAFGATPMWDRVVSLTFFIVSAAYLRGFVGRIASARAARLATLAYLALPLGQFYSRAAHVDFVAIAAAHGVLYHGARTLERPAWGQWTAAAAWGVVGALVKAPYLVPVAGVLLVAWSAVPSALGATLGGLAAAVTLASFIAWRHHTDAVNAALPDWSFLPGFYKESNALWWYVGSLSQRFSVPDWIRLARRLTFEVATPLGVVLGAWGMLGRTSPPRVGAPVARLESPGPRTYAIVWALGAVAYLLVFFPLNVIHNYYQMPFLAPAALLIGLGADAVWSALPGILGLPAGVLVFGLFVALALGAVVPLGYFRVDWLRVEAGHAIAARVPAQDLVVVADHNSGWSDPRLLFRADREGWPLAPSDLTPGRLDTLATLGARWVAVVTDPEDPSVTAPAFLAPARVADVPLAHGGRTLGRVELFRWPEAGRRVVGAGS